MRLELIKVLQALIIAFISYMITIPFAGWFESYVAKKVGDDTPEQAGFLTLNPLEHFSVFGFGAVLWGMFFAQLLPFALIPGWGRHIPLIPDNITGSYYKVRIFIEYTSRCVAHFMLLIGSATAMMLICGAMHVHGFIPMVSADISSMQEVIISLLFFICQQNIVLFIIHFILGFFKYLIYFYAPKFHEISFSTIVIVFIVLSVGLIVFGPLLELFVYKVINLIQALLLCVVK